MPCSQTQREGEMPQIQQKSLGLMTGWWLVVSAPLKKIRVRKNWDDDIPNHSQSFPTDGKIKHVPKHQPVMMFHLGVLNMKMVQTTNQMIVAPRHVPSMWRPWPGSVLFIAL